MSFVCHTTNSKGEVCNLKCGDKFGFNRHVRRMHTPISCKFCLELGDFVDKAALRAHEKTHPASFFCHRVWCDYLTHKLSTFNRHVEQCRASNERISCGQTGCREEYSGIRGYRKHLQKHHNRTTPEIKAIIASEKPKDQEDPIKEDENVLEPVPPSSKEDPQPNPLDTFPRWDLSFLVTNNDRLLIGYGQLTILYGKSIRGPLLAHLRMTKESIVPKCSYKGHRWISAELHVDETFRACHADYASTEISIHKGHVHRAQNLGGDKETAEGMFLFSITLPQYGDFNKGVWFELEEYERLFVQQYVVTDSFVGGVYLKDMGRCGRLPIPSHYFKVLIGHLPNGQMDVEIFAMKHKVYPKGIPTSTFHRTLEELMELDTDRVIPPFQFTNLRRFNNQTYREEYGTL